MATSRIVITVDKDGKEDINVINFNVNYLPYVLGRLVNSVIDDRRMTGDLSDEDKKSFRVSAADIFAEQLGIYHEPATGWIPVNSRVPTTSGPFFCKEEGRPTVYTDMWYDPDAKMFGTKEGTGYSFITHWYPYPKESDV